MASATKSAWKNPSYLQSSFGIFMFFCSWGIWWSFFQRWLISGVGLTNAEVGTIYSINSLATLVIMFVYGVIQDQLGIKRKLVIVVSVIAACVGPFVQFVYAPMILAGGTTRWIGALIGSIVLSAGFMSGCSCSRPSPNATPVNSVSNMASPVLGAPSVTPSWRCAPASCSTSTR